MGGINCSNCRTVKSDTEFVLEDYKQTDPFEAKVKALARNSVAIGKLIRIQRLYRRHCMDRVNKSKGIAPAIKV